MSDTIRLQLHNALLARGPSAVRDFCARHRLSNDVCRTLETLAPLQRSLTGGVKKPEVEKPKKSEVVSEGITKPVKKDQGGIPKIAMESDAAAAEDVVLSAQIPGHLQEDIDNAVKALPPELHSTFRTWLKKNDKQLDDVFMAVLMYSHRYDSVINSMLRGQTMSKEQLFTWYTYHPRLTAPIGGTHVSDVCNRMAQKLETEHPLDASPVNFEKMAGFGLKEHQERFRTFVDDMVIRARATAMMLVGSAVQLEEDVVVYRGVKDSDWGVIESHLNGDRQGFLSTTTAHHLAQGFHGTQTVLEIRLKAGTMVTFPMACSFFHEKELLVTEPIRIGVVHEIFPNIKVTAEGAGSFPDFQSLFLQTDDMDIDFNILQNAIAKKLKLMSIGSMDYVEGSAIPSGTTKVFFPYYYNKPVDKVFENLDSTITITEILFGEKFNQPVDHILPEGLRYLKFGDHFDQPVGNLPESLRILEIEGVFDHPVNALPMSLLDLYLDGCDDFDQSVDELPMGLQRLRLGDSFDQPVDDLPTGLQRLQLGDNFDQPVDDLPTGLQRLKLGDSFDQPVDDLPAGLQRLELGDSFDQSVDDLPAGLQHLTFGENFNQPINTLPTGLTSLTLGHNFNQPIDLRYLTNLEHIAFGRSFKQPTDGLLPPNAQVTF